MRNMNAVTSVVAGAALVCVIVVPEPIMEGLYIGVGLVVVAAAIAAGLLCFDLFIDDLKRRKKR